MRVGQRRKVFQGIEKSYRRNLSTTVPIIVRFDGKNVTKNHEKFHLMDVDGFTKDILCAAKSMVNGMECTIYAALDEVSVVFHKPFEFFGKTQDKDLLYSAIMILQDFLRYTREVYPGLKFNVTVYNIGFDQIDSYIQYRKDMAYQTAVTYYAKEYLPPQTYVDKSTSYILEALRSNGRDLSSKEILRFFSGTVVYTHSDPLCIEGTLV